MDSGVYLIIIFNSFISFIHMLHILELNNLFQCAIYFMPLKTLTLNKLIIIP